MIFGCMRFPGTNWYVVTVCSLQMVRDQKKFGKHCFTLFIRRLMQDNTRGRFSAFFKKARFYNLTTILRMPLHTQTCSAKKAKSLWMARSEITGIHFMFLSKIDKRCFENSSCKLMSYKNSANSSQAWQACRLLKFQLRMVCGSTFPESKYF